MLSFPPHTGGHIASRLTCNTKHNHTVAACMHYIGFHLLLPPPRAAETEPCSIRQVVFRFA